MKIKAAILCLMVSLLTGVSAHAEVSVAGGTLDREFDVGKTLYYVTVTNDEIPDINLDGYTLETKASEPFTGGVVKVENVTIIRNNETGKRYRFVIEKKISGYEISGVELSSNGVLTVNGNAEAPLKLLIFKPTEFFSDVSYTYKDVDEKAMEDTVLDVVEINAAHGKIAEYKFPDNALSGQYGFLFKADGVKDTYYTARFYMADADIEKVIEEVNEKSHFDNENTPEKLLEYVEKNAKVLYLNLDMYNKLSNEAKLEAVKLIESDKDYETLDEIGEAFYKGVTIAWIHSGKSPSEILAEYNKYMNLEMYDNYLLLNDKASTDKAITKCDNETGLRTSFNNAVSAAMINEAEPAKIKGIIEEYNKYLLLDSDVYAYFMSNSEKCVKALGNKNFSDSSEINQAIKKIKDAPASDPGGNGSKPSESYTPVKGSGSGGKYVAPVTQPAPAPIETVEPQKELLFDDISGVPWAHNAIEYLYNNKVLNGKADNIFAPNDNVTREEFVKLIVNAFNIEANGETEFKDVDKSMWYYDFLNIAANAGIVNGISDSEFGIGQNITREDICVMIHRAVKTSGIDTDIIVENKSELSDLDTVSEYAKEAVNFMIEKGAISGMDGEFKPHDYATRAQAARMIYQIIKIR